MIEEKTKSDEPMIEETSRLRVALKILLKSIGLFACFYFFICSLEVMSASFRLLGGRYLKSSNTFNTVLGNPLAGLMVGILITILVQSSSTSTSIVVTLVSAKIIKVKQAIPIIMGSNIGTSITSTFVSFSLVTNRENFRRAFAAATVHDIFNFLTVAVLLPLEIASKFLETITEALVQPLSKYSNSTSKVEILGVITRPLVDLIIQLEDIDILQNESSNRTESLLKHWCKSENNRKKRCKFLFESVKWPEWIIGTLLLVVSLTLLCVCLVCLVKLLNSIFKGQIAKVVKKLINAKFPGFLKYFTGYFVILVGALLTIVVQSSSVFTSFLTPLVGVGLVQIERVFPLILGSNIGTTFTGILAALSSSSQTLQYALQIALCHTFFNLGGILIWYPVPFLRRIPIRIAKRLGSITAEYRWFSIVYVIFLFFLFPLIILGLSLAGKIVFLVFFITVFSTLLIVMIINLIQNKKPEILPQPLRTWHFLPHFMRSLKPYDKLIRKYLVCLRLNKKTYDTHANLTQLHLASQSNVNQVVKCDHQVFLFDSNLYALEKIRIYNSNNVDSNIRN